MQRSQSQLLSRRMKRYVNDVHAIQKEFSRSWSGSQYDYRWAIHNLGKRNKTSKRKILEFLRGEIVLFPPAKRPDLWLDNFFDWEHEPEDDIKQSRPSDPLKFGAGDVYVRVRLNYIKNDKQILDFIETNWKWDGGKPAKIWHYRCRNHVREAVEEYFRSKDDSPTCVVELFRCTIKENQNAGVIHAGTTKGNIKVGKELSAEHIRRGYKKHHGRRKSKI